MLKVEFYDCSEIRMGSPYQICSLRVGGGWLAKLGDRPWQNKVAHSADGRIVALVYWDIVRNEPGFRVLAINTQSGQITESGRVAGCCDSISWDGGRFSFRTFDGHESNLAVN